MSQSTHYLLVLSPATRHQPHGVAVLEVLGATTKRGFAPTVTERLLRHLERIPGTTPPSQLVDRMAHLRKSLAEQDNTLSGVELVVDGSLLSVEMNRMLYKRNLLPQIVRILGGTVEKGEGGTVISKRGLVDVAQTFIREGSLKVPSKADLPLVERLERQLLAYRDKPPVLDESDPASWSSFEGDDLLTATALGLWWSSVYGVSRVRKEVEKEDKERRRRRANVSAWAR